MGKVHISKSDHFHDFAFSGCCGHIPNVCKDDYGNENVNGKWHLEMEMEMEMRTLRSFAIPNGGQIPEMN